MAETRKSGNGSADTAGNGRDISGLQALIERAGQKSRGPAPVEKWNPDHVGEMDLVIKADGSWHYMGSPITRQRLIELFSTVLRKDEDGGTSLVTPVERMKIRVEDAHFIAVEMNACDKDGEQILTFRTNVGDVIKAGAENPLRFERAEGNGGIKPYVLVRGRLEALMSRSVMYELMSHGEEIMIDGRNMFALRSMGAVFPVMSVEELERQSAAE